MAPEDKQAEQALRSLKGQAKGVTLTLEDKDILCEEGMKNMLKALDAHFKAPQCDSKLRRLSNFLGLRRSPDQEAGAFIITLKKKCKIAKGSDAAPNEDLKPLLLIKSSALTPNELPLALSALGATFTHPSVVEMLKRVIKAAKEGDTEAEALLAKGKNKGNCQCGKDAESHGSAGRGNSKLKCSCCGKNGHVIDKCSTRYGDQITAAAAALKGISSRAVESEAPKRSKH